MYTFKNNKINILLFLPELIELTCIFTVTYTRMYTKIKITKHVLTNTYTIHTHTCILKLRLLNNVLVQLRIHKTQIQNMIFIRQKYCLYYICNKNI